MTLILTWLSLAFAQGCGSQLQRFHVVRPRAVTTFDWDRDKQARGEPYSFVVGYPFEMQATQTTQLQWAYVMGENRPERPNQAVHRVSCRAIATFFERLNELSESGDERLGEFFEGHRPGDVYRLPTEHEWILVASHALAETAAVRGQLEVDAHVWQAGSGVRKAVQDVGTKQPLFLADRPFYDLFGNVEELTSDHYVDHLRERRPTNSAHRVSRGGSVKNKGTLQDFCTRRNRIYWREDSTVHDRHLGFRIVREYPAHHEDHVPFIRW